MNTIQSFNPLSFLSVSAFSRQKQDFSEKILMNMGEYIVARLVELLPEEGIKDMQSPDELFTYGKSYMPDFNTKIQSFIEDFKGEYKKKLLQL